MKIRPWFGSWGTIGLVLLTGAGVIGTLRSGIAQNAQGPSVPLGDIDGDGCVGDRDLAEISLWNGEPAQPNDALTENIDLNGDGVIDTRDEDALLENYGAGCQ